MIQRSRGKKHTEDMVNSGQRCRNIKLLVLGGCRNNNLTLRLHFRFPPTNQCPSYVLLLFANDNKFIKADTADMIIMLYSLLAFWLILQDPEHISDIICALEGRLKGDINHVIRIRVPGGYVERWYMAKDDSSKGSEWKSEPWMLRLVWQRNSLLPHSSYE